MENSPEIIHGRVLLRVAILVGCCFCEIIGKLLAKQARWSPTYISATFSKRIPTGIFPVFFPKVFRTAIYNSLHTRCLRETLKNSAKYCIHLSVNIYRAYKITLNCLTEILFAFLRHYTTFRVRNFESLF